jgi:hypothetical protein
MKTMLAVLMIGVLAAFGAGCAKKTASEQLRDDLKKAQSDMKREVDSWR